MECIGAIDQGTQSTRFFLYSREGKPICSHQVEFNQIRPRPEWVEHDPEVIFETVQTCIQACLEKAAASLGPVKVVAIGVTNQRETTIAWDRQTGRPLYNAIVWLDNRTVNICRRMQHELGSSDYFRPVTGLPISTYFSAYKARWMIEHVSEVAEAVEQGRCMVGTVDTWLLYKLTGGVDGGVFVTDVSNASRTNLMDLGSLQWHPPTCELFGLSLSMLPEIKSNAEVYGHVKDGPLAGVPISGCLGDQMAAMLGQRCKPHEAKNTYGTGCFLLLNTGTARVSSQHGLLTTLAYQLGPSVPAQYALEGSIAVAGVGVSWLRDNLGFIGSAAECEAAAASVPDAGGCYFVPAFSGLLAPHWRDDARGVIAGITGFTKKGHIVRALLEAICWQTRDVVEAMRQDADLSGLKVLRVDGGASQNNLLMSLQADILQTPVVRPVNLETTSLGAAYAAGIGVGFWTAEEVMADKVNTGKEVEFRPTTSAEAIDKRYSKWQRAVLLSHNLDELADDEEETDEQLLKSMSSSSISR